MSNDDFDSDFDAAGDPLPTRFQPAVLAIAPLTLVKHAAKGVSKSAEILANALTSHLEFQRDMEDFRCAAAQEIETLSNGEWEAPI